MAWWDKIGKGIRVERATMSLPQTATKSIFVVAGGKVLLTSIVGEITTVIQAAANATKLLHTPDTGTAKDLCTTVDFNGYAEGDVLGITGHFADPMSPATKGGAAEAMDRPIVLKPGALGWNCADSKTGAVKWTLHYIPLDDGAVVTAA